MRNKLSRFLVLSLLFTAFISPVQAEETSTIVEPGDEPITIFLGESNEFEVMMEEHDEELSFALKARSSASDISLLVDKQKEEISDFDEQINYLKDTYTEGDLLQMGYTPEQAVSIQNFDGTDDQRLRSAAISSSWLQINWNYYSNGYSYLDYDYIVEFKGTAILMGSGGTISAGTAIKSAGYYQRQSSQISSLYTSNGVKTGGNKTYRYPGASASAGNTVTYVLPGNVLLGSGDYVYLSRYSLWFSGKAQGNHTINNILAGSARYTASINGVGISFSGSGVGLSLSFKFGWKNINNLDYKVNR